MAEMVTVVKTNWNEVKMRADIADQYMACPVCKGHGNTFGSTHHGSYPVLMWCSVYGCPRCNGRGVIRKPESTSQLLETTQIVARCV